MAVKYPGKIWLRTFLAVALASTISPAYADVTAADISESIEKNNVFAAGIKVSVKINGPEVLISTYRNSQATNDDCKIEASIAAKTVFDLAPDGIARVKVFFFEPTLDKFKEVALTKGDVLSFAGGQTSQEDLLSSVSIKDGTVWDASANIADYLDASRRRSPRRGLQTRIKENEIEILTNMDSWVPDSECKLEAMKLAERALQAASGYKRVKIVFVDPQNQQEDRFIIFDQTDLSSLAKKVDDMMASIELTKGTGQWLPSDRFDANKGPEHLYASAGLNRKERADILQRIKALAKEGVGTKPLLLLFIQLEDAAAQGNQADVDSLLARLSKALDEQVERAAQAKLAKPTKPTTTPAKAPPPKTTATAFGGEMNDAGIKKEILTNPAGAYAYYVRRWHKNGTKPEDYPNYLKLMELFVKTLKEANRQDEAKTYEQKVADVKKLHPDW